MSKSLTKLWLRGLRRLAGQAEAVRAAKAPPGRQADACVPLNRSSGGAAQAAKAASRCVPAPARGTRFAGAAEGVGMGARQVAAIVSFGAADGWPLRESPVLRVVPAAENCAWAAAARRHAARLQAERRRVLAGHADEPAPGQVRLRSAARTVEARACASLLALATIQAAAEGSEAASIVSFVKASSPSTISMPSACIGRACRRAPGWRRCSRSVIRRFSRRSGCIRPVFGEAVGHWRDGCHAARQPPRPDLADRCRHRRPRLSRHAGDHRAQRTGFGRHRRKRGAVDQTVSAPEQLRRCRRRTPRRRGAAGHESRRRGQRLHQRMGGAS